MRGAVRSGPHSSEHTEEDGSALSPATAGAQQAAPHLLKHITWDGRTTCREDWGDGKGYTKMDATTWAPTPLLPLPTGTCSVSTLSHLSSQPRPPG